MRKLSAVHSGLRRVRRFRSTVRLGSAWSVTLTAALWALAAAFVLDYWIRMGRLERAILLAGVVGAAVWAVARYLLPALRVRESEVGLALLVERQQGLHSDVVAALQFAEGGRAQYGSGALREAVVDCTDEASRGLSFLEGFRREQLSRRMGMLAVTALVVVLPSAVFPAYTRAFLNRLFLLGTAHYPTQTVIKDIESPGGELVPYGRPVVFRVRAGGNLPPGGLVELRAAASDLMTTVELAPDANDPNVFVGRLDRILDDLSYVVRLGDAYTDPRDLKLIPLPLVELALNVTPPAYAAARFRADAQGGRQTVAPEGSTVGLTVTADKKLAGGTVTVEKQTYPLTPAGGGLRLDPAGTVFQKVVEPMRFRVQVVDEHGLSLDRPISGTVQVTEDRPPRIAAAAVSRYVLPTATPRIKLRAVDDYGVSRVLLHQTIHHADANQTQSSATVAQWDDHPANREMWHELALTPLQLSKGDRVTVSLEAIDYRGGDEGRPGRSDPISFVVTDREGLLEAMRKLDDQMVEKLDEIIQAQLGIGD